MQIGRMAKHWLRRALRLPNPPVVYTSDWFTGNIPAWEELFAQLPASPIDYLEVGSYEGRSANFVAERLPASRIVCVDCWWDYSVQARFSKNTQWMGSRLRKIKAPSAAALDQLAGEKRTFDIIYIDGSHTRWDVLLDTLSAWRLLRPNGIMIWDDYEWGQEKSDEERPQGAIDYFLETFSGCVELISKGYQVSVRKKSDWPEGHRLARTARQ